MRRWSLLLTFCCFWAWTCALGVYHRGGGGGGWRRTALRAQADAQAQVLGRMVERKKVEVDNMLRRHTEPDDPLVMRLSYAASECRYNMTASLRRDPDGKDKLHTMSLVVDMKRRSPTVPSQPRVVDFEAAEHFGGLLAKVGANALLVNTDDMEYGGRPDDLKATAKAVRVARPSDTPSCICKDLILHPIQVARALEHGAAGVLLIAGVVGGDLETLLDACTLMGTEALVEVHTPNELDFALQKGATAFLVNLWDRSTGQLHPKQAAGMASMFPMNAVTLVAGDIHSKQQVAEFGLLGYDGVVLGRRIAEVGDLQSFAEAVHGFRGQPRDYSMTMGMKALPMDF